MRNPGRPGFRGGEGRPRERSGHGRGDYACSVFVMRTTLAKCSWRRPPPPAPPPPPPPPPATRFARGGRGEEAPRAGSLFLEIQRHPVDAVAQVGRRRAVL